MSSQVEQVSIVEPSAISHRNGFVCFCGEWFPDRDHLDEHLEQHPDKYIVCSDCRRILPKGSWIIDEDYNFVSVE